MQTLRLPAAELTLGAVFLVAALGAMAMTRVNGGIALIWPANAVVAAVGIEQAAVMTALFGIAIPGLAAIGGGLVLSAHYGTPLLQAIAQWWSSHLVGACLFGPPFILFSSKSLGRLISEKFVGQNLATFFCLWSAAISRFTTCDFPLSPSACS